MCQLNSHLLNQEQEHAQYLVSSMKEKPDMHHHNLAVHYTSLIYGIGWALTAVNLRHPDPDDECHYL